MKKIEERLDAIEDSSAAAAATSKKVLATLDESSAQEAAIAEEAIVTNAIVAAALDEASFSLRTNLLYWCGGIMNIGAEWNPANTRLGVVLNGGGRISGIESESINLSGWFVSPELRYYLDETESWFVGVQLLAGGFDIKLFDKISPIGRVGNVYAGGVTGGYKYRITDTVDIDFNLGIGYTHFAYDTYYYKDGEKVTNFTGATLNTIMPIQAGVNVIYKLK